MKSANIVLLVALLLSSFVVPASAEDSDIHENANRDTLKALSTEVFEAAVKYGTAGAAAGLVGGAKGAALGAVGGLIGGVVKGAWDSMKNAPEAYDDSINGQLVAPSGPLEGGCIVQQGKSWGNCSHSD